MFKRNLWPLLKYWIFAGLSFWMLRAAILEYDPNREVITFSFVIFGCSLFVGILTVFIAAQAKSWEFDKNKWGLFSSRVLLVLGSFLYVISFVLLEQDKWPIPLSFFCGFLFGLALSLTVTRALKIDVIV